MVSHHNSNIICTYICADCSGISSLHTVAVAAAISRVLSAVGTAVGIQLLLPVSLPGVWL